MRRKPVKCVETGETWPSTHAAACWTGIQQGNITQALNGQRKTAGGLHWVFTDQDQSQQTYSRRALNAVNNALTDNRACTRSVYVLKDTTGQIVYCGSTAQSLRTRLDHHVHKGGRFEKRQLTIHAVRTWVCTRAEVLDEETRVTRELLAAGHPLENEIAGAHTLLGSSDQAQTTVCQSIDQHLLFAVTRCRHRYATYTERATASVHVVYRCQATHDKKHLVYVIRRKSDDKPLLVGRIIAAERAWSNAIRANGGPLFGANVEDHLVEITSAHSTRVEAEQAATTLAKKLNVQRQVAGRKKKVDSNASKTSAVRGNG